jgi:uncharacterized protein
MASDKIVELEQKRTALEAIIAEAGSALVAFSGGVDSALLAYIVHLRLGVRMLAVTLQSPSYPAGQIQKARDFAVHFKIPHLVIPSDELNIPEFRENSPDRCYHCKKEIISKIKAIAEQRRFNVIFDGTNADDLSDYRPGARALREMGVRSPFAEVGLTKEEIRIISQNEHLPTWDTPASACLASRIPYGVAIDQERLKQIEDAEESIRELGFRQFRVRYHGELARIEISRDELPRALSLEMFDEMQRRLKTVGFTFVTIDAGGYRTGSMNELLSEKERDKK